MDRVIGLIAANFETKDMGELTEERTVASLPYGGNYRVVDFPLSNMVNSGINTIGLITPYKYRSIIDHVGAGKAWDLDRKNGGLFVLPGSVFGVHSENSHFLLRDIRRNAIYLERSPAPYILVTAANVISQMDYRPLITEHIKSGADITMVYNTADRDEPHRLGVTVENGAITGFKPNPKKYEDAVLDTFVISRDLLMKIMEWYAAIDYLDFFEAIEGDLDKMDVRGYKYDGYARQMFTSRDYFEYSMELLNIDVAKELFTRERPIATKAAEAAPAKYLDGAKVRNSMVSAGSLIEGEVDHSILFRGVKVGKGAKIKNSIIMQRCVIEEGAVVENVILDKSGVVKAGSVIKGTGDTTFIKS